MSSPMNVSASTPDALRTLPIFELLTDTQLAWAQSAVKHRTYPARACILRAGETPEGLYVIVSGRVRLLHEDGDGHALIVSNFGPREFFGEMGLIDAAPCPASFHAVDACELACIPRQVFLECIGENAAAAMYVLRTV